MVLRINGREPTSKELFEAIRREPCSYGDGQPVKLTTSWANSWPAIWEREHASRWRVMPNGNLELKGKP